MFGNESSESLHSSSGLLCNHVGVCGFVFLCLQNTLETCTICSKPIMERILRATGKAYHPHCFTCVVCHRSLDGIPFTVDASNHIHCIEDFHKYVLYDVFILTMDQTLQLLPALCSILASYSLLHWFYGLQLYCLIQSHQDAAGGKALINPVYTTAPNSRQTKVATSW